MGKKRNWFWLGITLVFIGGFRFYETLISLVALNYFMLSYLNVDGFWLGDWLYLLFGWGTTAIITCLGIKMLQKSRKED